MGLQNGKDVFFMEDILIFTLSVLLGAVSLLLFYGRKTDGKRENRPYGRAADRDDGTPPRVYITGDTHRDFSGIRRFCRTMHTRRKDVLIILGDSGLNYYEDIRDDKLKAEVSKLNITLFCLHGNKECRPEHIKSYGVRTFCGGRVYYEPKYPHIFFAADGEVYTFEGRKYIVMGGAHSVDKQDCLENGKPFWEDEMPSGGAKAKFEARLTAEGHRIFGILTHTCPIDYLPTEVFISARQTVSHASKCKKTGLPKPFKPDIDRSTEEWLGKIEKQTAYRIWYCGHYHVDKQIDRIHMMHREIRRLHGNGYGDTDE